jgi:hypothetical protein
MHEEKQRPDGLVHSSFSGFYTAHYNEILLYKHFDYLLELCREFKLCFMVLSNGTTLTKNRVDIISEYKDVINGINLNVPIFTSAEKWAKRVNSSPNLHARVMNNIQYAMDKLPDYVSNKTFSIVVQGITHNSLTERGGWINLGKDFDQDIDLDAYTGEHAQEVSKAKELFPGLQIYGNPSLIDRAGSLENIISNKDAIGKYLMRDNQDKKVIGCGNSWEVGGRPFGWVHINANGECFLCCNDYNMKETVFGSFQDGELRDFWLTEKHTQIIQHSFNTMCRVCAAAKFN